MKFREKISFYIIVLKILLGSLVHSFPQTFTRNSYNRGRKLPLALSADVSPFATQSFQNEKNTDIWNVMQQPVYNTFNFPDIECPLNLKPKFDLVINSKSKESFDCKSRSNYSPKFETSKGLKIPTNKNEFNLPPEFSSAPNYRDIANFPEVEYPMSASEMWKPNYWNSQPSDYSYNNVNTDYYCRNPTLNEYFTELKSLRNLGTNLRPRTAFSTKSYSDSTKSSIPLKNKESNDNLLINGNRKENSISSLDSSKKGHTTAIVQTPYSTENQCKSNFNYEVCPKDPKTLDKSKKILEPDFGYNNLTSQSEVLVNACANIFKDEIKSVLKTMADNIIINNLEKVMAPTQLSAHTSDILESNSKCNNLNIYEEFTSPDLLKNRRSQDLNEYTKYNKDFLVPTVDLESKLLSTDLLIDSYADKFHKEMTSILKSNADDFLLNKFENSKSHVLETKINRSSFKDYTNGDHLKTQYDEHQSKDFSKINYEPILPMTDVDIHTHADKLHNEMSLMVKKKADNILLNKFESSNTRNKPSVGAQIFNNNNKVHNSPKSSSPGVLVNFDRGEVNRAMSGIPKTVEDNNKMPEYNKNPVLSDTLYEKKITTSTPQAPGYHDVSSNNNDFKSDVKQEICQESDKNLNNKTSISFDGLPLSGISRNDMICVNEGSVTCRSDASTINDMDKEDGILSAPDKDESDIPQEDSMNKEIELDEEFTTDSYPENDGFYALSTVAPRVSTRDLTWREVSVIEPDKSLYPDELEQYFIMN